MCEYNEKSMSEIRESQPLPIAIFMSLSFLVYKNGTGMSIKWDNVC